MEKKRRKNANCGDGIIIRTERANPLVGKNVYAIEVLESLQFVVRGVVDKPEVIDLPEGYLKSAGRVAQERATEAAYRLAAFWKNATKVK